MQRHKVLLIAYYYPPMTNVGVQRSVKFAKYLPQFGFEPIILTVGRRGELPTQSLERIYRALDPLLLYKPYEDRLFGTRRHYESMTKEVAGRNRLAHFVARNLFVPGPQVMWLLPALWKSMQIVRAEQTEVVFTTSPPYSSHLVGHALNRLSGIPWVADFRDGWIFDPHPPRPPNAHLRMAIERRMERGVIESADAVVCATPGFTDDFRRRFPARAQRITTITNGFDEEDYREAVQPDWDSNLFHIVHTGGFSSSKSARTPYHFLVGLKRFLDGLDAAHRAMVQVTFAGRLTEAENRMIGELDLGDAVAYLGSVPYREAIGLQMAASVLLLVTTPDETSEATGKLFEYLGAQRPILGLAQANVAAEIIKNMRVGVCVPPADTAAICSALQSLFAAHQQGTLRTDETSPPTLDVYSRRALTGQLQAVFRKLLEQ